MLPARSIPEKSDQRRKSTEALLREEYRTSGGGREGEVLPASQRFRHGNSKDFHFSQRLRKGEVICKEFIVDKHCGMEVPKAVDVSRSSVMMLRLVGFLQESPYQLFLLTSYQLFLLTSYRPMNLLRVLYFAF